METGSFYDLKVAVPTIMFGGLDTRLSEIHMPGNKSPDVQNMVPFPVGSTTKRSGLLCVSYGTPAARTAPVGSGPATAMIALERPSDGAAFLVSRRGQVLSRNKLGASSAGFVNLYFEVPASGRLSWRMAAYTDEGAGASTDTDDVFMGGCAYVVGAGEPFILTGEDAATWSSLTANSALTSASPGDPVVVTQAGHGYASGDMVLVTPNIGAPSGWLDLLGGRAFRVKVVDADNFKLMDADLSEVTSPGLTTASGSLAGNTQHGNLAVRRWPKGLYDASNGVRGYPARWDDPNADGNTGWPGGDVQDWPTGIEIIGQSLESRALAYGFALDPDRIDHSALGSPWNFLKVDVMAASEAAATTSATEDGGYFYADRGDGDRVVGVRSLGEYIVVFKQRKTILYYGAIGDDFRAVRRFDRGAVSDGSISYVGQDLYWLSEDGPCRLSTTDAYGDLLLDDPMLAPQAVTATIPQSGYDKIVCSHDRKNRRVMWFVPSGSSEYNNAAIVYYYPTRESADGEWTKFAGRYTNMSGVVDVRAQAGINQARYGAGYDGNVYIMDVGTVDDYNDSGGGSYDSPEIIEAHYVTRWYEVGGVDVSKRALFLTVAYGDDGVGLSQIKLGKDYSPDYEVVSEAQQTLGGGAGLWDQSLWNDDAGSIPGGLYWDQSGKALVWYRGSDVGRIFRFKIEDSSELGVSVAGISLDFRARGAR